MSEVIDSPSAYGKNEERDIVDGDEAYLDDENEEEDTKDAGKSIWFLVFAAILIAFFLWLLIGLWGYLQEMSYGHG